MKTGRNWPCLAHVPRKLGGMDSHEIPIGCRV